MDWFWVPPALAAVVSVGMAVQVYRFERNMRRWWGKK